MAVLRLYLEPQRRWLEDLSQGRPLSAHSHGLRDLLALFYVRVEGDCWGLRFSVEVGEGEPAGDFRLVEEAGHLGLAALDSEQQSELEAAALEGAEVYCGTWERLFTLTGDRGWEPGRQGEVLRRRQFKAAAYRLLSEQTGKCFPWGSLTGIRPQYIAGEFLASGASPEEAQQALVQQYQLRPDKAALALEVAAETERQRRRLGPEDLLLYVGVAFCPSRCSYCSFSSPEGIARPEEEKEAYVQALCQQLDFLLERYGDRVRCVYIGGGTPTELSYGQLDQLFSQLARRLDMDRLSEFCLEAGRSDSLTYEKLALARRYAVGRVCLNPQSMQAETMLRVGRIQTPEEIRRCYRWMRELGFSSINMDLIAGLPGESPEDYLDSVAQLLALRPENIMLHSLAQKRSAQLESAVSWQEGSRGPGRAQVEADGEALRRALGSTAEPWALAQERALALLRAAGYRPYYMYRNKAALGGLENIGLCLEKQVCLYNVAMMEDLAPVLACGAGAMNKWVAGKRVERLPGLRNIRLYVERCADFCRRQERFFQEQEARGEC